MVRNTWQLEASDLQRAHECADLKCSRHICPKHGSAGQCAWLASTGPSHGRGLSGRRHARWRVSLARLKASSGTYPGQQPRRRAGERETACCRRRMQRLSGQRPSGPSLERSRRSSWATAARLVADVLELVAGANASDWTPSPSH